MSSQNGIYFSIFSGIGLIIRFSKHHFKLPNLEVISKKVYSFNTNIFLSDFKAPPLRFICSIKHRITVLKSGTPNQLNLSAFQKSNVELFIATQANQSFLPNVLFSDPFK